jgi:hypothetical protein
MSFKLNSNAVVFLIKDIKTGNHYNLNIFSMFVSKLINGSVF